MTDFYEDMGYELPEEAKPIKSEGFEYYKHPAGVYHGVFGKLIPKYKDINEKKCEPTDIGAHLSHYTATLWITEFLGNNIEQKKKVVQFNGEDVTIPANTPSSHLYFPFMISTDPKWQWAIHQKFESWSLPGIENSKLVTVNPAKMTEKFTNVRAFPLYYGMPISFKIEIGEKKGSPYMASIKLMGDVSNRIPFELMGKLEGKFNSLLESERADRDKKDEVPNAEAPEADFSEMENEFLS